MLLPLLLIGGGILGYHLSTKKKTESTTAPIAPKPTLKEQGYSIPPPLTEALQDVGYVTDQPMPLSAPLASPQERTIVNNAPTSVYSPQSTITDPPIVTKATTPVVVNQPVVNQPVPVTKTVTASVTNAPTSVYSPTSTVVDPPVVATPVPAAIATPAIPAKPMPKPLTEAQLEDYSTRIQKAVAWMKDPKAYPGQKALAQSDLKLFMENFWPVLPDYLKKMMAEVGYRGID